MHPETFQRVESKILAQMCGYAGAFVSRMGLIATCKQVLFGLYFVHKPVLGHMLLICLMPVQEAYF